MSRFFIFIVGFACLVSSSVSVTQPPSESQCSTAKDFDCGFETECKCWRQGQDGVEDDIDWKVASQVAGLGWTAIPRSKSETNASFAFASRDSDHLLTPIPKGAMLISKTIPCLDKPVNLKLWYWKVAFVPQIRVCYKYFNDPTVVQCSAEVNGFQPPYWLPLTASLPAINRPFQIVVQAIRLFQAVAIDDITIEGDLTCKSPSTPTSNGKPAPVSIINANTTSPKDLSPANGKSKKKLCPDVKLVDSWTEDYNRGVWQPCENGTSCKQQTGIGAATGWVVQGEGTYVLESQNFRLETGGVLSFQYQFVDKSFTSKLRLCIDALDACPFVKRGSTQTEKWTQESILLPAGWHKIYFTVTNLKKTDHVKVRRISVRIEDDDQVSQSPKCTLLMTLIDE